MIKIINKLRKPRKTDFGLSEEELTFEYIDGAIKKVKQLSFNSDASVIIDSDKKGLAIQISSEDDEVSERIQKCFE